MTHDRALELCEAVFRERARTPRSRRDEQESRDVLKALDEMRGELRTGRHPPGHFVHRVVGDWLSP